MTRRTPRGRTRLALGGLALGALLAGGIALGAGVTASGAATDAVSGAELLARAEDAAAGYDFTGEVLVEWRSGGRLRRERVPVRERDGVLRVGARHQIVGVGDDRVVGSGGDWTRLWSAPSASVEGDVHDVEPDRKYTLDVRDGPEVAGRGTTVVEARRGRRVCERFALDAVTGLLLRREQFDQRGRLERAVGFVELSGPRPAVASPKATAPRAEGVAPHALTDLPARYTAPARLGAGFSLTGRYRSGDGGVHLFYTDGIYSASVFEQAGELDVTDLPDGAAATDFDGRRARSYEIPSGTIAVWSDDDLVYTLVSDAPKRDLDAVIKDLPGPTADDMADSVTEFVLAPFRW